MTWYYARPRNKTDQKLLPYADITHMACYASARTSGSWDMANSPPLSQAEIDQWFVNVPPPPPHTFELALVLGGTVAAGAYTAGALDFLFEALDNWTQLRNAGDPAAPAHRLQIRVITGASGGSVNAAIAARALAFTFPPVRCGTIPVGPLLPDYGQLTGNPFYDVWNSILRLPYLLETGDLQSGEAQSLLCGKAIDDAANYVAGFTAPTQQTRSYLGEPQQEAPLRVIMTATNLQGIPYRTVFDSAANPPAMGETFVSHADYMRYAVAYWGQIVTAPRPDELVLNFAPAIPQPQAGDWIKDLSYAAKASAAFPLGFPYRQVNRAMQDYRYRVAIAPADTGHSVVYGLSPDWNQLYAGTIPPAAYSFTAVDGGALDNEPIGLARTALSGVTARNPRDPATANRAVY
jgi:hypothetical protein